MLNEKGNSLVGVLIASGVAAIVATGLGQLLIEQHKSISYMEDRIVNMNLNREVNDIFSRPGACSSHINGVRLTPNSSSQITLTHSSGRVLFDPSRDNNFYGHHRTPANDQAFNGLRITDVKVNNINVPGPSSSGKIEIVVDTQRIRKGGGPLNFPPVRIERDATTDNTGAITSCSDDSNGPGDSCLVDNGSYSGSGAATVPSDTVAVDIQLGTFTHRWETGREGNEDHHSCQYGGERVVIYFGKTKVNNNDLTPGMALRLQTTRSHLEWFYGPHRVARINRHAYGRGCPPGWATFAPSGGAVGARCPASNIRNSGSSGGFANFWK